MLTDCTVVARHRRHAVLAQPYVVVLRDDSTLTLHPVLHGSYCEPLLRAVRVGPHGWGLVDLRTLAPALAQELRGLHERDVPGMVALTLRAIYPSSTDLRARVLANLVACWDTPPPYPPSPAAPAMALAA